MIEIACALKKPDGFVVVDPSEIQAFLDPLPVGRLWGVGKVTGQVFERLNAHTIGQLRQISLATLNELFAASGEHYWQLAHGIDNRQVVPDREAKSISNETTFAEDIVDQGNPDSPNFCGAFLLVAVRNHFVKETGRFLRYRLNSTT